MSPMCDYCGAPCDDNPYEFDASTPYCSEQCFIIAGDDGCPNDD
jgi:hypothetical protein